MLLQLSWSLLSVTLSDKKLLFYHYQPLLKGLGGAMMCVFVFVYLTKISHDQMDKL